MKFRSFSGMIFLSLLALLTACGTPSLPPHKEGEILVKYREGVVAAAAAERHGGRVERRVGKKLHLVRLPEKIGVQEAVAEYSADPAVEYAEPNYLVRKTAVPDDPRYAQQWSLRKVDGPAAWNTATGSAGVTVALLDTGIDYTHPDLQENVWTNPAPGSWRPSAGASPVADDLHGVKIRNGRFTGNPMDDDTADSHGTHVAGIVGGVGDNGTGITGTVWRTSLMAVKVLHGPNGLGETADVVDGFDYALDHGARIINCSLQIDATPRSLVEKMKEAEAAGALVISAAGNDGLINDGESVSPAGIRTSNSIAVASTDSDDALSHFSNYGPGTVDLGAPGREILSTVLFSVDPSGYAELSGTSMAAPHVSGVAALVWSAYPELSHRQVRARILNGADRVASLSGKVITGGRLNAAAALSVGEVPAIFSVSPAPVAAGGQAVLSGANFGDAPGAVTLGGTPLEVVEGSWSDTGVTVRLPAVLTPGKLAVNGAGVNGAPGTSFALPLHPPEISGITVVAGENALQKVFEVSASSPNGTIASYLWDFGDGTPRSTEASPTHTFEKKGSYTVTVTVTDSASISAGETRNVKVGSSGGGGGGCFIATAAWGSYLHPKVQVLRDFRDRRLLTNVPGRVVVAVYYRCSPPLADFIAQHESLRWVARVALTPVVFTVEHGWVVVAGMAALAGALLRILLRKREEDEAVPAAAETR